MKRALKILIDIFQPDDVDWMNFTLTKSNPYTFHHIVEKSKGGEKSVDNGAILTRRAHTFLHTLEKACPEAYNDLQQVFAKINGTRQPITQDIVNEIDDIIEKILVTHEYECKEEIDWLPYCEPYYKPNRKVKKITK